MTNNTDPVRALIANWRNSAENGVFTVGAGPVIRETLMDCACELEAALASTPPIGGELPPEDRFEQFVQAEIARSPDALHELGNYLADVLDEDRFPRANRLLLQLATEYAPPSAPVGVEATRLDQAIGNRVFYNLPHPYTLGRVIVYGEGEMGWYDYVLVDSEGLIETRSNQQYGSAEIALRDALIVASDLKGSAPNTSTGD